MSAQKIYISEAIRPAVQMLQTAFVDRKVSAKNIFTAITELLGMNIGPMMGPMMGPIDKEENEKEEMTSPCNPLPKEEIDKEERMMEIMVDKNARVNKLLKTSGVVAEQRRPGVPTLEEVQEFHNSLQVTVFTARDFFDHYEVRNWHDRHGCPIGNWRAMLRIWKYNREKEQENGKSTKTTARMGSKEREEALVAWLDETYPVVTEVDKEFVARYPTDCTWFAARVLDDARNERVPTIGVMKDQQWRMILRVTMRAIYNLQVCISGQRMQLDTNALYDMALTVLREYNSLTLAELMLAIQQFRTEDHGKFYGEVTTGKLLACMKRFVKWEFKTLPPPSL